MKMKSIVSALFLTAAVGATGVAQGATYDWGVHNYPGAEVVGNIIAGPFTDDIKFSVGAGYDMSAAVAVANNNGTVIQLDHGSFGLFSNPDGIVGNGDETLIGGWWNFDGTTGATQQFSNISAGNYYYEVSGVGAGYGDMGLYVLTSTIHAVPEPDTYAMLVAGLAMLGALARQRKQH